MQSPYTTDGAYAHRDLYLGALVPVLLRARRGFEAEGPKMLQLLTADDWTLVFLVPTACVRLFYTLYASEHIETMPGKLTSITRIIFLQVPG